MIIKTDKLVKIYNERHVVDGVSIEVEQGTVVGLLGPNGAGKTTTFYMIVGIETPNSGSVTLDGQDISHMPMYQRARAGIGYLPQEASIFSKMTVEDNIMAILETTGLDAEAREQKMNDLIEEFRLAHVRKSEGKALSGGERRYTARSPFGSPDVFLPFTDFCQPLRFYGLSISFAVFIIMFCWFSVSLLKSAVISAVLVVLSSDFSHS